MSKIQVLYAATFRRAGMPATVPWNFKPISTSVAVSGWYSEPP